MDLPGLPGSYLWSTVVLMELMTSARDDSQRKLYERLFRQYQQDNSLIVPDENDWLLTSRILYWLTQSRRRSTKGKLRRLPTGVSQSMALDVLSRSKCASLESHGRHGELGGLQSDSTLLQHEDR